MFNISRYEEKKTKQFQYSVTNITDRDAGHALKVERMIEKEERERGKMNGREVKEQR